MAKKIEHVSGDSRIDALLPSEMALACESAGAAKAGRDALTLFVLGILAGAFIALGAVFMTVVATGADAMPWGVARLLGGVAFSLGLILVIVGGAELFTGDSLMVVAYASRKITLAALLRAWALVYLGNLVGALATAALVFLSGHYTLAGGAVGKSILVIASGKAALPTVQLFFLSLLCNVLVCLAVWMSIAARSTADKVLVIVPPIAAFVAAGFEHSIANVFLLPYALMVLAWGGLDLSAATAPAARLFDALTVSNALHNIGVSTLGNLVGGSVLVGGVYWFLYLRRPRA